METQEINQLSLTVERISELVHSGVLPPQCIAELQSMLSELQLHAKETELELHETKLELVKIKEQLVTTSKILEGVMLKEITPINFKKFS